MSLFNELKRRNVFRVGIAYLVVSWLVMQVSDVVINNIGAPGWVFETILLLLGVGFPVVLVLAWALELTPEGIKKEKDVDRSQSVTNVTGRKLDRMIIGILTVVIAFLVLDRFVLTDKDAQVEQTSEPQQLIVEETSEVTADSGPSIAVLPFVNMSGDASNEYFSDGLTETLLHMLAQLPELRVAARTSSFAFKGKDTGIAEISELLGVAHILEGSVQKAGNRVRVTAQLIRAEDGFHVWSQNYDRILDDIFAIQDEIANDVAGALDASLLGSSTTELHGVSTKNTEAFDFYLQALEQQQNFSYLGLATAENLFKNALAVDPGFTDAKLALARNYQQKAGTGLISLDEAKQLARPLLLQVESQRPGDPAARALELMFTLLDFGLPNELRAPEAVINELLILLPGMPTDDWVRFGLTHTLRMLGQLEQALDVIQAGLMLDPLSSNLYSNQAETYLEMELYDKARTGFLKAIQLKPESPYAYTRLGNMEWSSGNFAGALNWYQESIARDPQDHELAADLANRLFLFGLNEEANRWAQRCYALAPQTTVCRSVQLEEARALNDQTLNLELAKAMLTENIVERGGGFTRALSNYVDIMISNGNAEDAFEFLNDLHPEMSDFEKPAERLKLMKLRQAAIQLMFVFKPRDEFLPVLENFEKNHTIVKPPWIESPQYRIEHHLFRNELEQAETIALAEDLSREPADTMGVRYRYESPLYRELTALPAVAARLRELNEERMAVRTEIEALMLSPEWNR